MSARLLSCSCSSTISVSRALARSTSPKRRIASASASSAVIPMARNSAMRESMWNDSSSSASARGSFSQNRRYLRHFGAVMRVLRASGGSYGSAQNFRHRLREYGPGGRLGTELLPPFGGQLVVLRAPIVLGEAPLAFDPAAPFHAVQGRVQRPFFDLEHVIGELLQSSGNGVPVAWPPAQCLQHENVERSLQQVYRRSTHALPPKNV